jgi:AcrR family transcriptional regulator
MLTAVNSPRRDQLIESALAVLRRDGPAGMTMRAVAAEAGVTATALYRHFPDKDALVAVTVREVYGEFRRALIVELSSGEPLDVLRLAFEAFLSFGMRHPNYYRLLFVEPHSVGIDRYPIDFVEGRSPTFRMLRDIVGRCMEAGLLATDRGSAADVALTVYACMHGLIMLYLAGRFPDPGIFRGFYHESMERLLRGLAAGKTSRADTLRPRLPR